MTRPTTPTLGLVVPVHNEEGVLPQLLDTLGSLEVGVSLTVLFVDDGSTDRTLAILEEACRQDTRMACLSLSRNFGQETAVAAGLQHARGDVIAVLDADLQDPPALLGTFIEKWREGYDVVYGIRTNRKESWGLRTAFKSFYWLLSKVTRTSIPRDTGNFGVIDRRLVDLINAMPEHNRFFRGLRGWVGFKQLGIRYERPARQAGKPSYNLSRYSRLAADAILSFSSAPLRIASWTGALAALVGFGYLVYILSLYLSGETLPPGWASLIVLVLFLGGIQLIVLGIIGEYISRIFDEVKHRPLFVTRTAVGWLADTDS